MQQRLKVKELLQRIPVNGCNANVNEMSAAGSIVEDSIFKHNNANLGRWKSPHSFIRNNTFENVGLCNLEVTALQQYLEGATWIAGVVIANNTFLDCPAGSIHVARKIAQVTEEGNVYN
jgi:hypothetical protein